MFIGHYGAALALKRADKNASLGWLFVGALFADILFSLFGFLGVERLKIVEHFTASTHFELVSFPYSHGLAGSIVWALVAYGIVRLLPIKAAADRKRLALVAALAVFSHWVLDLIVHTPDLPLLGDGSPKVGLGLWNFALPSFLLEAALLLGGMALYLRGTRATTAAGRMGILVLAAALLGAQLFNLLGPPPESTTFLAVLSLGSTALFTGAAFWLDRQRR